MHVVVKALSDSARRDQRPDLAVPALPTPVLVDHQPHSRAGGVVHDPARLFPTRSDRLLQQDRNPSHGGCAHQVQVGGRARDDVDEVRLDLVEHFLGIVIGLCSERESEFLGLVGIHIAHRRNVRLGNPLPRFQLNASEKPTADQRTLQHRT